MPGSAIETCDPSHIKPFRYSELPHARSMRLLRIHPGIRSQRLSSSLEIVDDLASHHRYRALSYCWGNGHDRIELICNGRSLHITKNLHAALIRLCKENESVLL
jgi:hypothetical protein